MADDTIVIFTFDNGGVAAGDDFAMSNLTLRAGKGYQFEGGIREPYFIKAPGIAEAGAVSDVPVTGADFYPTILDLIGEELRPEEHTDGVSLCAALGRRSYRRAFARVALPALRQSRRRANQSGSQT